MSSVIEILPEIRFSGTAYRQPVVPATDLSAYTEAWVVLNVSGIYMWPPGSMFGGPVSVRLQTSAVDKEQEYVDLLELCTFTEAPQLPYIRQFCLAGPGASLDGTGGFSRYLRAVIDQGSPQWICLGIRAVVRP